MNTRQTNDVSGQGTQVVKGTCGPAWMAKFRNTPHQTLAVSCTGEVYLLLRNIPELREYFKNR